MSDRHGTGLKYQFSNPLASESELHARDVKTKNPLKYYNYSQDKWTRLSVAFPSAHEKKLSTSMEDVGVNTSGRGIQLKFPLPKNWASGRL